MKPILTIIVVALLGACQTQTTKPGSRGPSRIVTDSTPGYPAQQLALVIGNSQYEFGHLPNPVNDATDMAAQLEAMGFEVTLALDLNQVAMDKTIRAFTTRLANQPGVGLFYFAGHGAQADGANYLLPIDNNKIGDKQGLKAYAINVGAQVLERMEQANNHLNIIILDACRDEPYRGAKRSRLGRGLARMQSAHGSILAYATAPGKAAADSSVGGRNSIYTKYLLKGLQQAQQTHQRIDDMLMTVSNGVLTESGGDQEPWYSASLRKPFCFGGCQTGSGVAMPTMPMYSPPGNQVSQTQPIPTPSVNSYRYTDNRDGTVTDNRTGLIWLKNANCFGALDWETAMRIAANLASKEWTSSKNCGLSDGSTAGMWRLPTIDELKAMIDKRVVPPGPMISNAAGTGKWTEGDAFVGVQSSWYWSSGTHAGYAGYAWGVSLDIGFVLSYGKASTHYVWPVRSGR